MGALAEGAAPAAHIARRMRLAGQQMRPTFRGLLKIFGGTFVEKTFS